MNSVQVLRNGAAELATVLGPHGFRFVETNSAQGSGGHFSVGEFQRGDRRLELHFRQSLGLVSYHVGADSLSHADLLRAVTATQSVSELPLYPGFSDDPLDGFRHLGRDLARFAGVFLQGSSAEFSALCAWVRQHPTPTGMAALR